MKQYEIANHLGNVRVTFSDVKNYDPVALSYSASLSSVNNYYSFGSLEPSRTWSSESYRFGFNGKENDNEVKGTGNSVDFGARIYDPRLGRWLSLDPLQAKYPGFSPYNFCANNPIIYVDPDGKDIIPVTNSDFNGTSNPKTVSDLAFTDQNVKFRASFNKKTNQYDIYATISISYSSLFSNSESGFDLLNTGLYDETKAHEETHRDQIVDAMTNPINISYNGKSYEGKMDEVFTSAVNDLKTDLNKKYSSKTYEDTPEGKEQLKKDQADYNAEFKKGKEQIFNQVVTSAQKNIIEAMKDPDIENKTNESVTNTFNSQGKEVKYLNGKTPVKLDNNTILPPN